MNEDTKLENLPFSKRLILDLKPALEGIFISNGMFLDSIEMDPVEDDEELTTVSGPQFTFRLQARAYLCNPKGEQNASKK